MIDMKKIIAFAAALLMFCSFAQARKVTGKVISGKEKLSGVIVTDGTNFTKTKKNGKFAFDIKDDAEFVYIVTPSGYVADWSSGVPAFYQQAAGCRKFVFDLQKTDRSGDYSIVAIADPQTRNEKQFAKFAGKPMEDLCQTAKTLTGAAAGLVLGDICWDSLDLLEKYKKEILRTGIPFYPVVGNHDHELEASGDINTTARYRQIMGPENYAFFMGKDVVIVVDNIIYDTQKKYVEGYADHVLAWVKSLERLLPYGADLYIAQHSPLMKWDEGNARIVNSTDMLDIVRGRKVTFISGHTHINNNLNYSNNITEHNVAAICGSWWDTDHCTDGTPSGYKVFTKKDGKLSWYYKALGHDKNHQVELYRPGQTSYHPNGIVVNVWDWDPSWKVEWFEDGKPMGSLKPVSEFSPVYVHEINEVFAGKTIPSYKKPRLNYHYFAAGPNQYAKNVTIAVENPFGQSWVYNVDMSDYVDVQAHRGGAGLMPENMIEAMKNALDMGVNTLELDLHVSKDGQVVVSHDPENIYKMTYEEIAESAMKPLASDLIDFVENYTKEMGYSPVRYNIEIKSKDAAGEGQNWPTYDRFVSECCKLLHSKHLGDRLVVQSFDVRALNYMNEKYPEFILSYLVDAEAPDFDTYMGYLDFTPQWLSPHHTITDEALVKKSHEKGMKIVPWTVDKPEDIKRILDLKVDAIISNYPDRVLEQTRGFVSVK